jgi:DNA-binding NarL/FixJ family response regulator
MIDQSWRILIADHSLCFLESLQIYLSNQPKFHAVDISTSLKITDQLMEQHNYDLIIVGDHLIDATLLVAAKHIASKSNTTKIAAFCTSFSPAFLLQHNLDVIKNLISKKESLSSLLLAIHRICRDEIYVSPYVQHLLRIDDKMHITPKVESALSQLSPRQINVLTLLANGMSVKEVAKELHLSPKSVDSHKYRLMLKLNIKGRVELARFAIREGLIEA